MHKLIITKTIQSALVHLKLTIQMKSR